jgi:hypothetical protein
MDGQDAPADPIPGFQDCDLVAAQVPRRRQTRGSRPDDQDIHAFNSSTRVLENRVTAVFPNYINDLRE